MHWGIMFFVNAAALGVGLAMDAFSVSVANGLNEPQMRAIKRIAIPCTFGFFQAFMPLTGWFCVNTLIGWFGVIEKAVPAAALLLLGFIGGKMIYESLKGGDDGPAAGVLTASVLLMQGIATSIDALSVGFTIASYTLARALVCAGIIAAVTFCISTAGVFLGRRLGVLLAGRAGILGGVILIAIGLEIFIKSLI